MLKKREAELSAIIENTGSSVWSIDNKGCLLFANTTFKRQFSLAYGVELKEGVDLKEMVPKTQIPFWVETHNTATKNGRFSLEHKLEIRGASVDFEISVNPIIDENGKPVGAAYFSRDITERKKIEESLRESEEKFRGLFESATDVMVLVDATGRVLDVNKKAVEAFGGSKGELVGKHFTRACLGIMPPTQISKVVKGFVAGLANKKPNLNVTIKNKKGQTILLECSASLLKLDDRSTGLLVVGRDITERKRAEEELARSEAKYRSLVDQSLQGMVVAQGVPPRVVFVNPTMIQISGYTSEELASIPMERLIHPDDRPAFFSRLKDRLEGKSATSPNEYRAIRKDGKVVWIDVFSSCVEHNGQPAVQATFIDITERKEALERLRVLNEKLGVVGKLTRHDVRNKLSAVVGNTYLAKKTLPNDHKALAYLKEIESACGQTTRILDFAAAYESLGVEELTLMDVDKAVEEAVSLISELKGVKVVNNCQRLTVMADAVLKQLFFNLIENSLKHGKNVSQIKIHYVEGKDRLKLFYEDNGVGIPKANKPRLFDWGFTTGHGSEYGLPLIKSMMEIYGWTIEEEGEPGKGAKFVITIPMRADSNQKQRKSNKKTFY
jgi:PAS domain S-box-containing protein